MSSIPMVSETNTTALVWRAFGDAEFGDRPHEQSSTAEVTFKHQPL